MKNKKTKVSLLPNFSYEVVPKQTGLAKLHRRLYQSLAVLFSPKFSSIEAMIEATKERYGSQGEIDFYMKFVECGLLDEEEWIMERVKRNFYADTKPRCLVVGCGTGREVFSIEEMGYEVVGVDNCGPMIEGAEILKAEKGSSAEFLVQDYLNIDEKDKFDVVFFTFALLNHIPRKKNRVAFLLKAKNLLNPQGQLVLHCDEYPLKDNLRFQVASILLRFRWWRDKAWEPGDTVRSFLGTHYDDPKPLFFHYYVSHHELMDELNEAGFLGWQCRRGWVAQDKKGRYVPLG